MVFVPFTAIDNHRKSVTIAVGMLKSKDTKSYIWLLESFMSAFNKQPTMVVTDQDGAMKKAIAAILPESKHRLCMWHITQKVPAKVLSNKSLMILRKVVPSLSLWTCSIDEWNCLTDL